MKSEYMSKEEKYQELVDMDFPDLNIGERARQLAIEKGVRGNVRASLGMFYTNKEWEKFRKKVLETDLP